MEMKVKLIWYNGMLLVLLYSRCIFGLLLGLRAFRHEGPIIPKFSILYDHNVITPKAFRIGSTETVILNLYEYSSATVTGYLRDLPSRLNVFGAIPAIHLSSVTSKNPVKLQFTVNEDDLIILRQNPKVEMVIEVKNSGLDFTKTIVMDVSKKSGYLFVQTDRPIYKPNDKVEIRVYPLDQTMAPEKENKVQVTVKTPDGIGAYRIERILPPFGFIEAVFSIAEHPVYGTWSVEAKFSSRVHQTTTDTKFVIRRYVLPTFNVQIDMEKNFFFVTDNAIRGHVRANYSYGEPVEGNYFLSMKLKKAPNVQPIQFFKKPGTFLLNEEFINGEEFFDIPMDELLAVLESGETLITLANNSASIFIEATVNARADGIMESDITQDIPFLKSPYRIDISKTTKHYTPRFTYHMQAYVQDVTTGKPAQDITVKVSVDEAETGTRLSSNDEGQISTSLDFSDSATHNIRITTAIAGIEDADQSSATIVVMPYLSPSRNYIQITISENTIRVGQSIFLTFRFQPNAPSQVRYLILARGTVVSSGTNTPIPGNRDSTQQIVITQEMVPSCRVIAYYMIDSEVVSSSLWLDVVDQCKQELSIEVPDEVLPGANVPFKIKGAPQAIVGVSGVDKAAYFLFDKERLTRDLMFKKMEGYDEGCVRSGGSNGRDVFAGAGVQFYGKSESVSTPSCIESSSYRRSKRNVVASLAELAYKLDHCERDGKREDPSGEECEIRGRRCRDNYEDQYPGCWKRFRDACLKATTERLLKKLSGLNGTGSEAEAEASIEERRAAFQDDSSPWIATIEEAPGQPEIETQKFSVLEVPQPTRIRSPPTQTPQVRPPNVGYWSLRPVWSSWKPWSAFHVRRQRFNVTFKPIALAITTTTTTTTTATTTTGTTPVTGLQRSDFKEKLTWPTIQIRSNGEYKFSKKARDSITTFLIDAVGMHNSPDGFCVAHSTELRVFKDVFVQLNTPFSLKVQEQTQLRIVVFNYNRDAAHSVVIRVKTDETFCTRFRPGVWSELLRVKVAPNDSAAATLSILPLKIPVGELGRVEIEIRTPENVFLDLVRKEILIEPEGEIKDTYQSYPLDLKRDNQHIFDINFKFPEKFVADTRKCWIYAYTNFMGPSIEIDEVTKEPRDIKSIFRNPYGCGEQSMIATGPNVYAHMYLRAVSKIHPGTGKYMQSVRRMQDGFNRQLQYRSDRFSRRAWAVFTHYLPSTWLNAYVDRVFIKAKLYYTGMDMTPVCSSLDWLLGEQNTEGYFRELRPPVHREMHGAVGGILSLTAYVLITLIDAENKCSTELNNKVLTARQKAVAFLMRNKDDSTFQRSYGLSLLTYAIALHEPTSDLALELNARLLHLKQHSNALRQTFWRGRPASEIAGTDVHAYWYNQRPQAVDVEATAYALLAQIEIAKAKPQVEQTDLDLTRQITLWLISQRNDGGAFISTQDTVVGLQALATYMIWINQIEPQQANTAISIILKGQENTAWGKFYNKYSFKLDERYEGLKKEIPIPFDVLQAGNISVSANGTGEGVLSYRCIYRTVADEESCHFHITQNVHVLNAKAVARRGVPLRIKLTITVSKPVGPQAEASILDIGLMSGFTVLEKSLQRLAIAKVVDGTIERYEINNHNIVLYLNSIKAEPTSITFRMEQSIPVDNPQPAKINVYDYYEPSVYCGLFYSLPGEVSKLRTANCDGEDSSLCKCAEGVCPVCRTREQQLYNTRCLMPDRRQPCVICDDEAKCDNMSSKACSSNFVFIVNITSSPDAAPSTVFASFEAQVIEVLKIGNEMPEKNAKRTFTTRSDCHAKCNDSALDGTGRSNKLTEYIQEGRILMIMGTPSEQSVDKYGHILNHYHLGENTMMERVIPKKKCENAERSIQQSNLQCDDPNFSRNQRQEAKCLRLKKFRAACRNIQILRENLRNGCD